MEQNRIAKKHFEVLDGLRGGAALAVVIFHFMEVIETDYRKNFIAHGFLAVDFFFCLSGFVIAYAYDNRIRKLGVREFFKARLIRLHPLVILGSVLGLLGFLFNPFGALRPSSDFLRVTGIFIGSLLLIPLPIMPERPFNLFSFNTPAWSLFWEYIANIGYAFVLSRIRQVWLWILVIPSAVAVCLIVRKEGNLWGGWNGPTFWDGFIRVSYSFLAGLLLFRSGWIIKNRLGFGIMCLLLSLAFLSPYSKLNGLLEPLIVLVYFPLLVALGAGTLSGPRQKRLCVLSGKISYPLYMTHYWLLWIFADYNTIHRPSRLHLFFIASISVAFLLILAYVAMVAYDIPIRRKMEQHLRKTGQ